jgi:UDP-glucose 4-epimerase
MNILLTGGAGYIASHTAVALAAAGHTPVIFDNFSNSHPQVIHRLSQITGRPMMLIQADVANTAALGQALHDHEISAVIHFAAFKAVGESVKLPMKYYQNNVGGLVSLLAAMDQANCRNLVFSSSCTVYGDPKSVPISEDAPTGYTNPYGHSKLIGEQMLQSLCGLDPRWKVSILRYFNPVGAHESGLIGEDPADIPNNLMPFIAQVAIGLQARARVFGHDYPTADGTGVRDYIHVMDLAQGHLASLEQLMHSGSHLVNLGTGQGYSVLQVIRAYEKACGRKIPFDILPRRPGDIAAAYADTRLANQLLGWKAQYGLDEMCASSWKWQSMNPKGYSS